MDSNAWHLVKGDGPLVATAVHSGHSLRPDLAELIALSEDERLREEDPYTDEWASVVPNQIIGTKSRFEVDLNRPKEKAVYLAPEDAWGLHVWKDALPDSAIQASLAIFDGFYEEVRRFLDSLVSRFERVVVYDLHTYNHRRNGPNASPADSQVNPEVNVGTGTMYRSRWTNVVDRFLADLHQHDFCGRKLDVRENVKFFGGHFPTWIHENYPSNVCVLSMEFKKFFMDEWTGEKDIQQTDAIREALASTVGGVTEELENL